MNLILDGNKLNYDISKRNTITENYRGKQAFLVTEGDLVRQARKHFGRREAVLKVFNVPMEDGLENYYWGSPWRGLTLERTEEICKISKLTEATTIQNLLWLNDMAPRVYGFVIIEQNGKEYPAQVTEFVKGDYAKDETYVSMYREKIERYLEVFGCVPHHKEQAGVMDYVDGKLIDPQGCRFTDKTREKMRDYIIGHGIYGKGIYQSDESMGFGVHPRDTKYRLEATGLNLIDFSGKRVLDIGCNVGVFCNYAEQSGAERVVGLDTPDIAKSAWVMSFYLGHHNIDYVGADLKNESINEEFDITLFLSMNVHIGFPEWVAYQTKELMIFEENAKGGNYQTDKWIEKLSNYFQRVELKGYTTDHNPDQPKPVLFCYK